jgi:thiamine-monophosphate kinase
VSASDSEFELIDRHFRRMPRDPAVRVGIGDDGAVVAPSPNTELVVSVDMLVEGRHFFPGTDAQNLGHKTLAVNLSDLAAMGATPRFALLAGALPDNDDAWLAAFMRGFRALADRYQVELIGGDTTRGPRNFCVTVLGELPVGTAITRGAAQPGDDIYVSGVLGDAALAVAALQDKTMLTKDELAVARRRLECPEPRVELGIRLRGVATSALDISDGLTGDLAHILEMSHVGAQIDLRAIPRSPILDAKVHGAERTLALACLLAGGDDYELCFTARKTERARIAQLATDFDLPLTRIGEISVGSDLLVRDEHGMPLAELPRGFDHFASGR